MLDARALRRNQSKKPCFLLQVLESTASILATLPVPEAVLLRVNVSSSKVSAVQTCSLHLTFGPQAERGTWRAWQALRSPDLRRLPVDL